MARVLDGEGLDVDDARLQAGRLDGDLALLDVLRARRDEQHVDHVGVALAVADDLEVEADFLHRERNVLVGLELDLAFEIGRAQILRHLDHFRDRGVAADRDGRFARLRAGALVRAANRFADGFGVDDGFFVDGVRRGGLGCVGFDPIPATARDQLDELHRRGGDIEADQRILSDAWRTQLFLSNTRGWVRILHVPSTAQFNYISLEIYTVVTGVSIPRSSLTQSIGPSRCGICRL